MTTISLPQLAGANLLTHSRMQTFKTCPRKHYYAYELGVRPTQSAQPLRMGSAVHLGLDLRAQGRGTDEAILAAVAGYEEVPKWCDTDEKVHEWMVERTTVATLLSAYFWYWEREGLAADITPVEWIESEKSFDLPIKNPDTGGTTNTFRFAGKRDQIVKTADAALVVMENKTCGEDISATSDYWKRLRFDHQISGYVTSAHDEGKPVADVLYNVIRKPTIAPKLVPILDENGLKIVLDATGNRALKQNIKKNGEPGVGHGEPKQSANAEAGEVLQQRRETPDEFGERLRQDIGARPEFYFARQRIPRLESDLIEFRQDLWAQQQTIRDAQRYGRFFRNTAVCTQMGRCAYLDHCLGGFDLNRLPVGFERVTDIHPELSQKD